MNIKDFSDWHIDIEDTIGQSVSFPGQGRVTEETKPIALELAEQIRLVIQKKPDLDKFIVNAFNIRYRVQNIMASKYAVRMVHETPDFAKLNVNKSYVDLLCRPEYAKSGGLILISGPTGSGKTSTAVALVRERLKRQGDFALTVEDPPEFIIRGHHGENGYCEQMDASEIGYDNALSRSLRCFPSNTNSMLFFGEIRQANTAAELLRIAINGHLVITTIHAKDIVSSLQRLLTMASSDGEDEARFLLSSSLRLAVNQHLENGILQVKALECDQTVASIIQNNRDLNLTDAIARTMERLKVGYYSQR